MLFAPAGPNPGSVTTNFRMFVGLCANGNALRERARTAPAAVPRDSSCRLVIVMWVPLTCANETLVPRRRACLHIARPGPHVRNRPTFKQHCVNGGFYGSADSAGASGRLRKRFADGGDSTGVAPRRRLAP